MCYNYTQMILHTTIYIKKLNEHTEKMGADRPCIKYSSGTEKFATSIYLK